MDKIFFDVPITEEEKRELQKAYFESKTYNDNMRFLLSDPSKYSEDYLESYTRKVAAANATLEEVSNKLTDKYCPKELWNENTNWNANFAKNILVFSIPKYLEETARALNYEVY